MKVQKIVIKTRTEVYTIVVGAKTLKALLKKATREKLIIPEDYLFKVNVDKLQINNKNSERLIELLLQSSNVLQFIIEHVEDKIYKWKSLKFYCKDIKKIKSYTAIALLKYSKVFFEENKINNEEVPYINYLIKLHSLNDLYERIIMR